ncbi:MAG: hypothetical protein ABEJ35_03140 [Halobacteriaceae archaeon]
MYVPAPDGATMDEPVRSSPSTGVTEYCPRCGQETTHEVRLELQAASEQKYSRQPHRISQCIECERTVEARVGH